MKPGGTETRATDRRWIGAVAVLVFLLAGDVVYRGHTLGSGRHAGLNPSEPLDCDEAAYAYIGHRLLHGDVMYRDLTENKPPLGYWLYEAGVALGGYDELAIRVLPVPFVLGTLVLLFWLGGRLAGPWSGCLAAGLYAVLSTDPYLFGNGSNMEHFMNFFSVGSLALLVRGRDGPRRWPLLAAGLCLGAATLVKQVAILPLAVYLAALIGWPRWCTSRGPVRPGPSSAAARHLLPRGEGSNPSPPGRGWPEGPGEGSRNGMSAAAVRFLTRLGDGLALTAGLVLVLALAAAILAAQGAGTMAYEDIMQYGRALATDTLPEPHQPSAAIRWLTGNADPSGKLPWPFGATNYLVWWGTGSWPLWLAAIPCVLAMLLGPGASAVSRLVAGWTIAAALEVVLPGLYWQHYYLLPTPGIAVCVAAALAGSLKAVAAGARRRSPGDRPARRLAIGLASSLVLGAAILGTIAIQVRSYLLVPAQELTVRYKGGGQWVVLRSLGEELARRSVLWPEPRIYIWGWQSPLHFYGRLDGVTRHFFVDNLLRDQAERDHPLIRPRIAEIMRALKQKPPALIFAGYPPFPELAAFLRERYVPSRLVPSRDGLGLWVERSRYAEFENFPAAR